MIQNDLKSIILTQSELIGINPHWLMAIIQQESAWNPFAIRYELTYRYLYHPELFKINTLNTELIAQRTSWGLGQLMGAVARELGHLGYLSELLDPKTNIYYMCLLISRCMKTSSQQSDIFAMYNGGEGALRLINGKYPNQTYVDSVTHYLSEYETGIRS